MSFNDNDLGSIVVPQPLYCVGYNSVTYVQGSGMSFRVIGVPGSDPEAYVNETAAIGLCQCSPPAVWQFTCVGLDGRVVMYHTLDSHEAMFFMQNPDELFDTDRVDQDSHMMLQELKLVPESEGIGMVVAEATDWLASEGFPLGDGDNIMSYDDVVSSDPGADFEAWLRNRGGDDPSQTE